MGVHREFWWGNLREQDHGRTVKRIKQWERGAWIGSIWLNTEHVAGCCEYGNEPWNSIKFGECFE
jgi:hypothetical protein